MTELIVTVILIVTGLIGMPIINALKEKMGLSGNAALALASAVSIILAVLVTLLSGQFATVDWSLPSLVNAATVVFAAATIFYKVLTTGERAKNVTK